MASPAAVLARTSPDTGRHPALEPEPLFQPAELGLDADSWDDLRSEVPRCQKCKRPLREERSLKAGIGPCCAAKIGWAVYANMRKAREARKARTPGQQAAGARRRRTPRKRVKARA